MIIDTYIFKVGPMRAWIDRANVCLIVGAISVSGLLVRIADIQFGDFPIAGWPPKLWTLLVISACLEESARWWIALAAHTAGGEARVRQRLWQYLLALIALEWIGGWLFFGPPLQGELPERIAAYAAMRTPATMMHLAITLLLLRACKRGPPSGLFLVGSTLAHLSFNLFVANPTALMLVRVVSQ